MNESGVRADIAWGLYTTRVYMAPAHAVRSRTKVLLANSVWQDGRYNIVIKSIGKKKYIWMSFAPIWSPRPGIL
jgi:hypothetical protein